MSGSVTEARGPRLPGMRYEGLPVPSRDGSGLKIVTSVRKTPEAPLMCTTGRNESVDEIVSAEATGPRRRQPPKRIAASRDEGFIGSSVLAEGRKEGAEKKNAPASPGRFETVRK